MLTQYPAIKPYATYELKVSSLHTIYVEECGEPDGIPVVFLHGGPGGGCDENSRRFFDPKRYRIILFDQRGCGRSTPHAELAENNTQALISDMEAIREHCNVDQWLLFGGSWGSTLALLYGQQYPGRVKGMILRGIFLCRKEDIHWFYQDGASKLFPDHWDNFLRPISAAERHDLLNAYHKILTGQDEIARLAAAKAWSRWEGCCSTLEPSPEVERKFVNPHLAMSMAQIECHFFYNKIFMEDNAILNNMDKIKHIPAIIVHGRYDVVCPLDNAYQLHHAWPGSMLQIIRDAGHSAYEPAITSALVHATNTFGS